MRCLEADATGSKDYAHFSTCLKDTPPTRLPKQTHACSSMAALLGTAAPGFTEQTGPLYLEEVETLNVKCITLAPKETVPLGTYKVAGKGKHGLAKKRAKKKAERVARQKVAAAASSARQANSYVPSARGGATITCVPRSNKLFVCGGANRQGEAFAMDTVEMYDIDKGEWYPVTAKGDVPPPSSGHSVVAVGQLLYLFGGMSRSQEECFNDVYVLNTGVSPFKWTRIPPEQTGKKAPVPRGRNGHSATLVLGGAAVPKASVGGGSSSTGKENKEKQLIYVFGGGSPMEGPSNDLYVLDVTLPDDVHWLPGPIAKAGLPPAAREMHSAVLGNDGRTIYIFGGQGLQGLHEDLCPFDLATSTWKNERFGAAKHARCGHVASAMRPNHMAVVGGFDGVNVCNTLMILNLDSTQWTEASLKPSGPPTERFAHSACMDPEKSFLYVYGGSNTSKELNDLIRYDLSPAIEGEQVNQDGDQIIVKQGRDEVQYAR